jgi:hypothetical protein
MRFIQAGLFWAAETTPGKASASAVNRFRLLTVKGGAIAEMFTPSKEPSCPHLNVLPSAGC